MRRLIGLFLAALVLMTAVPAFGAVVINRGIAGVTMGMTPAQVRARLGTPLKVVPGKNFFGPTVEWRYRTVAITWMYESIVRIRTASPQERTSGGIGVGSTKAQVRRLVYGVRCEGSAAAGICYVGGFLPGAIVTTFRFARGRVIVVEIGRVLD